MQKILSYRRLQSGQIAGVEGSTFQQIAGDPAHFAAVDAERRRNIRSAACHVTVADRHGAPVGDERHFRRATGLTPRAWRESRADARP